ncbi:MAG: DsrE family protein [Rubrivivax sp.]|nr:DsrE family protein [Rubrivivax sp.]
MNPTLSFALMDAPFESARSTAAHRLIAAAARRGCHVKVFAYEGAVMQPFALQQRHANAVHGLSVEEENHCLPREVIGELMLLARQTGGSLEWINCGLCVDERGAGQCIDGVRRGTPADFWQQARDAVNTLVIATRE